MSEPIVAREVIAQAADIAACETVTTGAQQQNPYPCGSAAAAVWTAAYERYLLLHSTGEVSA
jgi:hypothetical protein